MNKNNLGNTDISSQDRLPFSQACENNQQPILNVLQKQLQDSTHVLEVGSGTGQHSVYFVQNLPHIQWQTSDVIDNHQVIRAWHDSYPASNLHAPLAFDLAIDPMPSLKDSSPYDAIFTANTLHIMAWSLVQRLFELAGEALPLKGKLIIYGPFNEHGRYTSASNQSFDLSLRQRDLNSGIRDKEDVVALAKQHNLKLSDEYQMPANNQILVFMKT
ncbi:DUF938 domain-containing protein [Psychrobacter sp. 1U2]|uniref:DUF938 domain-containing protein n=1 Tax=Psychrobacter sp. 1U2 TaxID=3453577 RepID=UPI003F47BAA7